MGQSNWHRSQGRDSYNLRRLLDQIESHLNETYPEVEEEKIKKVMLLLFGPEPDRFVVPEEYKDRDD